MVVCAIITAVAGALFMTLSAGNSSVRVNSERVHIQAKVRTVSDWICRDLRNAISWELNANTPGPAYLKFNVWSWDSTANTWKLGNRYIEYSYDTGRKELARRFVDENGNVLEETIFTEIMYAPFYTSYTDQYTNQFDGNALLANRMLFVVIRADHTVTGRTLSLTLVSEVKIRNG